jgi:hypothetical protein
MSSFSIPVRQSFKEERFVSVLDVIESLEVSLVLRRICIKKGADAPWKNLTNEWLTLFLL